MLQIGDRQKERIAELQKVAMESAETALRSRLEAKYSDVGKQAEHQEKMDAKLAEMENDLVAKFEAARAAKRRKVGAPPQAVAQPPPLPQAQAGIQPPPLPQAQGTVVPPLAAAPQQQPVMEEFEEDIVE